MKTNDRKKIAEMVLKTIPYHYYYSPPCSSEPLEKIKQLNRAKLNCSDKAPHQEEIEYLLSLGLTPQAIGNILVSKFYSKK